MKNYRRLIILSLMAILLLLSVGTVASQSAVTIRWWHINTNEAEAAYFQAIADEFMAENPHVTIEITILENEAFKSRLITVMQAGDPPDLFQSWGGGVLWTFSEAGLVRDISAELEGEWRDSFNAPAALELYGLDGEYYGVPFTWGTVGIFYNKDLFEQAGLDAENPPETWEEFLDTVQTLKDAGITPISLGGRDKWPGHFWWVYLAIRLGGEDAFLAAYNRDGAFTDEPFVEAGEYLQQLIALEPFPSGFLGLNYNDQAALVGNGQAAMELMGHWGPAVQAGNSVSGEGLGEALGWFPFPTIEGGLGNADDVLGGGDGFAVGINAPDETIDFLRFLTNAQNQRVGSEIWLVPVVAGTEDVFEDNPVMSRIIEARNSATYSQLYYDQFLPPAVGATVNDAVEMLFAGVASPEQVAQMIEDETSFELD